MAGESAREIAQRRREKARRLNQVADAYERGADGERQTAAALAMLPASEWFVLHDVGWPGRRLANIDHVAVGPAGVFVIDSKAWTGSVDVRNGVLRQNGYQREQAVAAAADAAIAVGELVPGLNPYAVKPVLCFVGNQQLDGWARDVILCTPRNLVEMLVSRPQVLDGPAIRRTWLQLQHSLAPARRGRPSQATVRRPRLRTTTGTHPGVLRLVLSLALVGALALGAVQLIAHADDIARGVVPGVEHPQEGDHRLGAWVGVPAGAHRPPLRIRADRARSVRRVGATPYLFEGNRFFGVRVTIRNVGKRPWHSQPGTSYGVTDSIGVPHPGGTAIRIREGEMLTDPIRIPAGGTVSGYVVFQVGADDPVTALSMTVGPGDPETTSWAVDHQ